MSAKHEYRETCCDRETGPKREATWNEQQCPLCGEAYWQGDDGKSIANAVAAREPLVQEVIAAHAACSALSNNWSPSPRGIEQRQNAGLRLKDALDKLAGWKP